MKKNDRMNILYCIDETKKDYSRFLWVSILSLLENNKDEDIHIYVITTKLEDENKKELERIVTSYNKTIKFSTNSEIIPKNIKDILYKWGHRPIAVYYRLFFNNCFPEIKDRLLYFDCDTIINKNLSKFYNVDFGENIIAGQFDIPMTRYIHKKAWLDVDSYINSWVLLFNVPKFIEIDLFEKIEYANRNYTIIEVDQDYINIIFKWKILLYDRLQAIVTSRFFRDIKDFLVIHTIVKPDHPFSQCPKNVVKIFDDYLKNTKWKNFYKNKKVSFIGSFIHLLQCLSSWITYISEKIFWLSFTYKLNRVISNLGAYIWNFRKNN